VDAAPETTEPPAERVCPNCGAPAPGRFCAACGQRQDRKLASVRRMALEGIQDQLSVGSELPVTLAALLFRPGKLTNEYLAGRIARYVPPLRLYLVASLAFFFILSFRADIDGPASELRAEIERDSVIAQNLDRAGVPVRDDNPFTDGAALDTVGATGRIGDLKRWAQRRLGRLGEMERDELQRRVFEGFQRNAPRAVFVLLPIYALFLKLLYARRHRLYAEHFVFTLHVHAFVFVLFTLMFVLPDWLDQAVLMVWIPAYVFFAMLRVYGQGVGKTLLKYVLLFFAYCSALLVLLVATVIVVVLTI
jgi:hypothetical protein